MANIKSQIKRNRQNDALRLRNLAVRSQLRTYTRQFREVLASGDRDKAQEALRRVSRAYDVAVSKGVVHKNNAANHKSRLAKALTSTTAA